MDHGDHSGHGGHSMPMPMPGDDTPACSMNMLWNNQIADTCVVFQSWHISGPVTMAISCLAVILISLFYSYLLHSIKSYDRRIALNIYQTSQPNRRESSVPGLGGSSVRRESLIPPSPAGYNTVESGALNKMGVTKLSLQTRLARGGLYAVSVAISFWLMLVAMTYNTYLFGSIVVGAFLGHILYEDEMDVGSVLSGGNGKGLACH
ncbi:solute carrier family 31 (copper transporter), member 1 [Kwoniella heveanensis CBS 569]|nr:solute carrier family 31 (copper transporter), member 1 [Kwoniella heveanensis CBS 569]